MTLAQDNLRREYFSLQRSLYDLKVEVNFKQHDKGTLSATEVLASVEAFKARTLYESMIRHTEQKNFSESSNQMIKYSDTGLVVGIDEKQFYGFSTENLLKQIFSYFSKPVEYATEHILHPLNAQTLPDQLRKLPEDQAVIYYFLGENISLVWLLSAKDIGMYKLDASETLNKQIELVANNIGISPYSLDDKELASQQLYIKNMSDLLLENISKKIKDFKKLTIIPDGAIQKIPFSLLINPINNEPLLATHSISYGMSLATINYLEHASLRNYKPGSILLVANPQHSVSGSTQINNIKKFKSLPYSVYEVESIASIWSPQNGIELLTGKRASKRLLIEKHPENFEVLHFASHAMINWEYPELTSVALSVDDSTNEQSPFLTIGDITQWNLSTELVVLSACETAVGKQMQGEGSMGLSRAFFDAGAKRVVASLWPIEDEASAFLMKEFYKALMQKNVTPPKALQMAQYAVSQEPLWSSPYYWAGMVYFGNQESWRE